MKTWKQFLLENTHSYSSTQVNLPQKISNDINKWAKDFIKEEDLYFEKGEDYGRETETHVTILYGLNTNDIKDIKKVLKDEKLKPVTLELKETSIFECEKFDVVKFTVKSEDLVKLNKIISKCDHDKLHSEYNPHCTLAYVKKGTGKKYSGNKRFNNTKVTIDNFLFSNKNRVKTKINLS